MKTFEYKPDEDSGFTGFVKIKMPTYKKRLEIIKEANIAKLDDEESGAAMLEMLSEHVEQVALKRGKQNFESLDDLGYTYEGVKLTQKMSRDFITGIPLGNL